MNRLADETGVDRKLYKAALTEVNANFALYMAMYDAAKSDAKTSVQNDVELDHGLTADALDRMHRFTRLVHNGTYNAIQTTILTFHYINIETLSLLEAKL